MFRSDFINIRCWQKVAPSDKSRAFILHILTVEGIRCLSC